MNIYERQVDLLQIINQLDISPSMCKNAIQKYESIRQYLQDHGLKADMYPQGSFALGTVVRPYSKDKDKNYDLDFVCQVKETRDNITPSELRNQIADVLKNNNLYGGKLVEYDECFTIEYADIGGVGFSIDVVPAAEETRANKEELRLLSRHPELIDTAIAIPRYSQQKVYNWITNNPKGYRQWFDDINLPFRIVGRDTYRQKLYETNKHLYSSIDEIPVALERSAMQRVVQILKYHRDVYYSNIQNGDELKPISAIINTVVAEISRTANPNWSVFELLQYVLEELAIYAKHLSLSHDEFNYQYGNKKVLTKKNGQWKIENPANPKDNLANKWNENAEIPRKFFQWTSVIKEQLIDSLKLSDEEFRAKVEMAFGHRAVSKAWNDKYNPSIPRPISTSTPARPWSAQ